MRPRERRESGEQDLFCSRLDQVINMDHALVKLARTIDWRFLEEKFGAVYKDGAGQLPLPTRLMAGLAILKHTYNVSDEVLCKLWVENPYYQYFCGEEFFQHRLPLDRSSMTNWRNRMGHGDFNNAVLAAVGYNFRRLIRWLRILLRLFLAVLFALPNTLAA
jgi:IS5 family transposase